MSKFLAAVLALLLASVPLEVSGKHVVKHKRVQAQTAGCTVGGTPPSTGCGIGDMAVGGALSATDAIAICQQPGGCPASASTWQLTKMNLLGAIRGAFNFNSVLLTPTTGTILQLIGPNASNPRVELTGFGIPKFDTVCYGGTGSSPLAVGSGVICGGYDAFAFNGTAPIGPLGGLRFTTTEAQSSGHGGMKMTLSSTANGSTTPVDGITLDQNGQVTIGNLASATVQCVQATSAGTLALAGSACGTSGGGLTGLTLAPGLTVTPGTYNTGTGTPATVVNGSQISSQAFYEAHTSSYTVLATDSGKILEATATGVTFTLPSIGAIGSGSYSFSYGGNPYTITGAANIYGCGPTGTSVTAIDFDVVVISNGSTWKCFASGMSQKFTASWGPNVDLTKTPVPILTRVIPVQIATMSCIAGGLAPSPATVDLCYSPDGTVPNATCSNTGVVKLTNTLSCKADTTATAGTRQAGLSSVASIAAGTVWMVGTGTGWQGGGTTLATVSGEIQIATVP